MKKEETINFIKNQIDEAIKLENFLRKSPEFNKWKRDTEIIIEKIFWDNSRHIKDFTWISYSYWAFGPSIPEIRHQESYVKWLKNAQVILSSMINEIEKFWTWREEIISNTSHIELLSRLCHRFFLLARQIRTRHDWRDTLEINDEYDVQDLFHALLHIYFDDIRPEEWTPSYAWNSSRTDFLLKNEETVIEIKMTRKWLDRKETANQLIIDKERYRNHPNCKYLVCFIYDHEWRIWNPIWFENDLNSNDNELQTIVIVTPKWH